jgi:hypothetical protein
MIRDVWGVPRMEIPGETRVGEGFLECLKVSPADDIVLSKRVGFRDSPIPATSMSDDS